MRSSLYPELATTTDAPDLLRMSEPDRTAYIERVGRAEYVKQLRAQLKGKTVTL